MATLRDKFRGCLLGATLGDVIGAAVEAESPGYIANTYRSVDDILATESVEEFTGPPWRVGRFTDDTQMMLCVAEWLVAGESNSPERLLARFAETYDPDRRYGPGTESILNWYRRNPAAWRELATAAFPEGSLGNGSAMRVAPVGLAFHDDLKKVAHVARESSRPTHTHTVAYQGAALQATAVAVATRSTEFAADEFLRAARHSLRYFDDLMHDTSKFSHALDAIEAGISRGASCAEMADVLGTGVTAHESVPIALYCFFRHPDSYEDVIHQAVFLGGDTDTIAAMTGAISGAFLGETAIPQPWLAAIREPTYHADSIQHLADQLLAASSGAARLKGPVVD